MDEMNNQAGVLSSSKQDKIGWSLLSFYLLSRKEK